jgi:type IV secretory pathway TrbL component
MTMVGKATRIGQAIQWVLAAAMVGSPMAGAQQVAVSVIPPVPGADMQAGVTMNVGYQVKDDLFGDTGKFANGASEVTEINLDPNTMGMVGRMKGDTAQKMKKMVVHSYKYDKPGMYRMEDLEAYRKKLEDGSWSCSIHVRSKNESTDICSRKASDHETNEMVIMTAAPQELTFIHMC